MMSQLSEEPNKTVQIRLTLKVNGELKQDSSTALQIFTDLV
ncbi:MAG: hypothetical protein QGH44_01435 [Arenicellales bacterium]|jgi:2-keto-4-pentenoate hydratase/2-oxohepta-3-ene-1,7-dioic acid hydratase in catechol pathway|nr:hypothetical protein [Arenicellales bacterium]|tara:strand:+ start:581 stop:703 length:123 start_codon:yes stop_codon:yes gene_type:complete